MSRPDLSERTCQHTSVFRVSCGDCDAEKTERLRKVAEAARSVYRAWDRDLHYVNKMFALGRELRDVGYELKPVPRVGTGEP